MTSVTRAYVRDLWESPDNPRNQPSVNPVLNDIEGVRWIIERERAKGREEQMAAVLTTLRNAGWLRAAQFVTEQVPVREGHDLAGYIADLLREAVEKERETAERIIGEMYIAADEGLGEAKERAIMAVRARGQR